MHFLLLVALALLAVPVAAQPLLTDAARTALVTIEPGDDVYSRWGHTAIRIQDPDSGLDRLYNYGTFQFDRWFVFKFAYGQLDYILSVQPPADAYYVYARYENRSVIEQTLNLTGDETRALFAFLEDNARPENRTYRYDFLFDNCSTRPRDAIERALGDRLRYATPRDTLGVTFRTLIDPFVRETPALDTGLDLLLGLPVDKHATRYHATFLPDTLRALFDEAQVVTPGGTALLVTRTDTIFWAGPATAGTSVPWHALLIGLFATLGIIATWRTGKQTPGTLLRVFDALLFFIVGVAGLLLAFLWFVSLHYVTGPNLNLFWAWPTHVIASVLALRRTLPLWARRYFQATALFTGFMCVLWPLLPQTLPLPLWPLALLVLVRAWARSSVAN